MAGINSIKIAGDVEVGSRRNLARLAGYLYLAYIVLFAFATFVQHKPFVWNDPTAMARNIGDSELMLRISFMSTTVADLLFLSTAWALYVLLKPVNKNLAALFVLLNLAGVAVECVYTVLHFDALMLLGRSDYLHAFKPEQLQPLSMFFLDLGGSGNMVTTLFYGAWLFPLGYLVFKSGFLPRFLGVLLLMDGVSMMICFIQICLFPGDQKLTYPLFPIMLIAELGLALWLIVKGVNDQLRRGQLPSATGK